MIIRRLVTSVVAVVVPIALAGTSCSSAISGTPTAVGPPSPTATTDPPPSDPGPPDRPPSASGAAIESRRLALTS